MLNTNGSFTYTPAANYNGADSFTYKANDGSLDSNIVTVTLTVNPVNDAPLAMADTYTTDEDTALVVTATGLLSNDTDDGTTLTSITVTNVAHGALTLATDGGFTYTPVANFNGEDSFTYKANDGSLDSNIVTVTLTVNPVNDAPVALTQSVAVSEFGSVDITLAGIDVDGDSSTFHVATAPLNGTLSLTGAVATYSPNPNYHGPDNFTFAVSDDLAVSAPAAVTISVNPLERFNPWLGEYGLIAGPGDDSDGDSISNGIEYVIGGNPANRPDADLLPTLELVSADLSGNPGMRDYLLFRYRRTDQANTDPSATIKTEWGTDLAGSWTNASETPQVVIEEVPDGVGVERVKVYIPRSLEVNGCLFARLNVLINSAPLPESLR
jgi:VCBS repeat-containing protein